MAGKLGLHRLPPRLLMVLPSGPSGPDDRRDEASKV